MIRIQSMAEHDAEALSQIQKQAFAPLYKRYQDAGNPCLRGAEDILGKLRSSAFRCFTVLKNDSVIGGVFYRQEGSGIFFERLDAGEYYLQRVFIQPALQSRGVASAAIRLCEEALRDGVKYGLDFPVDLLKNRRCYEKVGFRDTGRRFHVEEGLTLACMTKCAEKDESPVRPVYYDLLPDCLDVIHRSFATVAQAFGLTRENCPRHTSFMPLEKLQKHMEWGWYMFGLFEGDRLVGYASLSNAGSGVYELHNLAVLPECRRNGYGKLLLDFAKRSAEENGASVMKIGIIEESLALKRWYAANGFVHTGAKKVDGLPFTAGNMIWEVKHP